MNVPYNSRLYYLSNALRYYASISCYVISILVMLVVIAAVVIYAYGPWVQWAFEVAS